MKGCGGVFTVAHSMRMRLPVNLIGALIEGMIYVDAHSPAFAPAYAR